MLVYIIRVSQGSVAVLLSVVGFLMTVLSQMFHRMCQWNNYENPFKIDEVIESA